MARRVLDTSVLIKHWHDRSQRGRGSPATDWAEELFKIWQSNETVTPVVIEFLCGATSGEELADYREFLSGFKIIDNGLISAQDWQEAKQMAERVPRDGKRRQLGDCLVMAISQRLSREVVTHDRRMRR